MKITHFILLTLVFLTAACAPVPNGSPIVQITPPVSRSTTITPPAASSTPRHDLTATQDWVQFQSTLDTLKTQVASVKSSTPTVTVTPSPMPTVIPYPTKQVLLEYTYDGAGLGAFGDFVTGEGIPDLILYSDGQLIIHRKKLYEKQLSVAETCSLLKNIKDFGYYQVVYNGDPHDRDNPLYMNLPPGFSVPSDQPFYYIVVNGPNPKAIEVEIPFFDYLVPAMKETIQFLQYYQPTGMKEYQPDRLLLYISSRVEDQVNTYFKSAAQWPEINIHLSDYADPFYLILIIVGCI